MGKYLKLFDTHSDYNTYINSQDKILPNVSYCENENEVHYNPIETRVVAKFNVTSTSSATTILANSTQTSEIEIDGVIQPSVVTSYTFDTTGEHTVKYTLADPTTVSEHIFSNCINLTNVVIPNSVIYIDIGAFQNCTGLTNVTIPNSVTTIYSQVFSGCSGLTSISISNKVDFIGNQAFAGCINLTNVVLPNSVSIIGNGAFIGCMGLTSVTIQATTPPVIYSTDVFSGTNDCPIYVPSASVETYKAATNWSSFASRIQSIP